MRVSKRDMKRRTLLLQERAKGNPRRSLVVGPPHEMRKKKKDMSKVKCFACHKPRHFTNQCPNKKKHKGKSRVIASA